MTVKEFLAKIDPVEENWKTLSPGHWENTVTGAKYDTSDIVQAQLDAYNANAAANNKPRFIPGITPVPEEIKVTPGGTSQPPTGGTESPRFPGGTGGLARPPATGGGIAGGGRGIPTNYIPGSTWNPTAPGAPGAPPTGPGGFGGGMQWQENAGSGTGGPQRTGRAMPFSPYGVQQDVSSEILQYGGKPNSGAGGSWTGTPQASAMMSMFTPRTNAGSAAGALDPFDIYNSAITNALRNGTTQQARPNPGEGYQNVTISNRDGELWTDPRTGQAYVFRNGAWQKTDTTNRPGPVLPEDERTEVSPGIYDGRPPAGGVT